MLGRLQQEILRGGNFGIYHGRMAKPDTTRVPDGTEQDFRDLLELACTTIVPPSKPESRAPKGKSASVSAPKAE